MDQIGVGHFKTTPRMRDLINLALDNNRLSYGPLSKDFEWRFATMHNANHAILSNSGTSALQVALQAMKEIHGWEDGDEVIIPAVTFVATANIVLHNRMVPVPVDVDHRSYNMAPLLMEQAITPKTRAVIPVHLFGQMADMTTIAVIAQQHGLKIIEDSCECVHVTHCGHHPGELGNIAAFSTYVAHLITTGVGGLSLTNDPTYAAKMRSLVNHGRDGIYISIDDDKNLGSSELREVVNKRFRFESVGHSFRVTELEAAIGLAQLEDSDYTITTRQYNAHYMTAMLDNFRGRIQLPTTADGNIHAFMMYPMVMLNESKWDLCNALEENGIETREMMPLINQPAYEGLFDQSKYPVANWINDSGFYVGCHPGMGFREVDRIVSVIEGYFAQ